MRKARRKAVTAPPSTYSISMGCSSKPIAAVGVGDGEGKEPNPAGDQNDVQHGRSSEGRMTAKKSADQWIEASTALNPSTRTRGAMN